MTDPHILHVDLDAFFASVEQVLDPALRGRPVVVGSADGKRGVVASASYEARAFGVRAAMPIFQARKLCPQAVFRAGSYGEYERFSREVFDVLAEVSPTVEGCSLDEGYVDLTGCERLYGAWSAAPLGRLPFCRDGGGVYVRREARAVPPARRALTPDRCRWIAAVAAWIKHAVRARTGLNVSVGCATNKLVAKAASDFAKPNGLAVVPAGAEADFFLSLPLEEIPGIGQAVRDALHKWNVRTVAAARRVPAEALQGCFGDCAGRALYRALRGEGETELAAPSLPAGMSRETTFWTASSDRRFVEAEMFGLTERLANALRRQGLAGRTVHLKLRYEDFATVTLSRSLREPTCAEEDIFAAARGLLDQRWCRTRRLRLVGVGVSRLGPVSSRQGALFDDESERQRRVHRCLDNLRGRFGFDVVQRGPRA